MLKKTVNYTDFDGTEKTEELRFNLTQTELVELAMDLPDGVSDIVKENTDGSVNDAQALRILETLGGKGVYDFIKKLVLKAYGEMTTLPSGRIVFKKSPELTEEFSYTAAYDAVVMELMTSDENAANFVNGLITAKVPGNNSALPMN